MKYQPMVRVQHECLRDDFLKPAFHLEHCLSGRDPRSVGDPEYMRIDGDGGVAKRRVQHDVGGLATYSRQGFQRDAIIGHLSLMQIDQHLTGQYDVAGLGLVQAYCLYILRSEEHTSELQSRENLVCRLLLEKKK